MSEKDIPKLGVCCECGGKARERMSVHCDKCLKIIQEKRKHCGICKTKKKLIGPYAGGPFIFWCSRCMWVVRRYLKKKELQDKWWAEVLKQRGLNNQVKQNE